MTTLAEHRAFLDDILTRQARRRAIVDPQGTRPPLPRLRSPSPPAAGPPSKSNVANYIAAEEAVRNDYAAWYGVSGECGIEHVLGARTNVCEEFPALRRLLDLKAAQLDAVSHAPLAATLGALGQHRFDAILIHPRASWAETAALPVRQLSADPGFVFLWVGAGDADGLERGRECLARWGFRRAEDIVCVGARGGVGRGLLAPHKAHCLMGIRGTVRRSTDGRFVHCNVDTDVIVDKDHIYALIENFCLGARRLELFGGTPRRGWVNVGGNDAESVDTAAFDATTYASLLPPREEGKPLVPYDAEIDSLRPKSPQRRARNGRPNPSGPPPTSVPPMPQPHSLPQMQLPPHSSVMRMGQMTPAYDPYGPQHLGPAFAQMGMGESREPWAEPAWHEAQPWLGQPAGHGMAMMPGMGAMGGGYMGHPGGMLAPGLMPGLSPQQHMMMMAGQLGAADPHMGQQFAAMPNMLTGYGQPGMAPPMYQHWSFRAGQPHQPPYDDDFQPGE